MSTLAPPPRVALHDQHGIETERFLISRISTLNVLLKRRAAIYAKRSFHFTLTEWRIMTLLRTLAPLSVRELALEALVDAAQISRAAAKLAKRGLLSRKQSPLDNREAMLTLTKRGMQISVEMCRASLTRNDQLLEGYHESEVRKLVSTLDDLIARAHTMVLADEEAPKAGRR